MAAPGGDASACGIPDDLWRPGMNGTHLGDQHGEAVSVAKWWSTASSPPSAIARRRHWWRRLRSVDHMRDDLVDEKGNGDVREMPPDEEKREG